MSLRERNRSVFSSYSQKEYCSGRRRSRCHIQVIHVSLSCARRCENRENPVAELHIYNCMWYKKEGGKNLFNPPSESLSQVNPGDSALWDAQSPPRLAHGQKCRSVIQPSLCERLPTGLAEESKYPENPPFAPNVPFILDVARF